MTSMDRRDFLRAAAAGAALSMTSPAIQRALAIPADNTTGTIEDVQHIVIFMQENRAFDHYFGTLPGVRGFSDRITIPLPDGANVWQQSDGTRTLLPFYPTAAWATRCSRAARTTGPTPTRPGTMAA